MSHSDVKSVIHYYFEHFDPKTTPEIVRYHGPPQVVLAYLKYLWSLREDQKCKEAFARLHVGLIIFT